MRREFYYQDDRFNKFWTAEVQGRELVTTNGRIGAKPREVWKEFGTPVLAQREAEKLVAAKLRSGYVEGKIASAPAYAKPDWSTMTMSEEVFLADYRIVELEEAWGR